jgi:hypothetical protein
VEYYCREGIGQGERAQTGGRVLPVLHIHHDEALRQSTESEQPIDEYWHTREILKYAVRALTDLLREDEELSRCIKGMSWGRLSDLRWFFDNYPLTSLADWELIQATLGFTPLSSVDENEGCVRMNAEQAWFSPIRQGLLDARHRASPIEQLYLFVNLMCVEPPQGFGFEAVYILLDGLDEFSFSADLGMDHAARLLVPLLSNLRLVNGPNMAFKCFLPAEISGVIRNHATVRRDRLGLETLVWSTSEMEEILRRRLATYGPVQELDMLCLPEIRGLERDLIELSDGNPRRMIRLCDFMLQAHLESPFERSPEELGEAAYLFSRADWQKAQQRIESVTSLDDIPVVTEREPLDREKTGNTKVEEINPHLEAYPAPIALPYLDYRRRQGTFERVSRMLDLFEATAAFVAVILIGQLSDIAGDETAEKLNSAGLRLRRTSLGAWLAAWQRVPGLCNSLVSSYYARQLQSVFSRYYEDLDRLRILRNETRGHGATGSEQDALEILDHYGPKVEAIILALEFLSLTQLIKVKDTRMEGDCFEHRARIYRGSNPNFPWNVVPLTYPLESDKLLLMRKHEVLSMHPFMIVEFCHECHQEEIFTYQQVSGREVQYLSYQTGHRLVTSSYLEEIKRVAGV